MGRRKKRGERYPSGDLKPPIQPALWWRVRHHAATLANDARLSSQLGRYSFHRQLSDEEVAAGFRVGAIYGLFERDRGLKRRTVSPSYERGFTGASDIAEELLSAEQQQNRAQAQAATAEMFMALQIEIGVIADSLEWPPAHGCYHRSNTTETRLRTLLEALCVEDCALLPQELDVAKAALDRLADYFGTSQSRKKKRQRQRRRPQIITAVASAPTQPKTIPVDRVAFLAMLAAMRPDLDGDGRAKAWDLFLALKDRESFARRKQAHS